MIRPERGPRFGPGNAVRVLDMEKSEHHSTPAYVKSKRGRVSRVLGGFPDPESLAYGGDGLPKKALYKVRFRQTDLWEDYWGSVNDVLHVDIYEHWLENDGKEEG